MKPKKKFISDPRIKYLQRTNPRLDNESTKPFENDEESPVLKDINAIDHLVDESLKLRR